MKIALDFDGVIVKRDGFPRKKDFFNDPPVEGAKSAIRWLIDKKHDLYILTSREEHEHKRVKAWMELHNFPKIRIKSTKEKGTKIYLDDRAIRFTNWLDFTKLIG